MSTTVWPSSDYAAKCCACGQALGSAEPRVREDKLRDGMGNKRESWHPQCYAIDPLGEKVHGSARVPTSGGGPRIPRVTPPSAGSVPTATGAPSLGAPSPSGAGSNASSGATATYAEPISISVEEERTLAGHRVLLRLQQRVPEAEATATANLMRELIQSRIEAWMERPFEEDEKGPLAGAGGADE